MRSSQIAWLNDTKLACINWSLGGPIQNYIWKSSLDIHSN